jgi:hypothetical protein
MLIAWFSYVITCFIPGIVFFLVTVVKVIKRKYDFQLIIIRFFCLFKHLLFNCLQIVIYIISKEVFKNIRS